MTPRKAGVLVANLPHGAAVWLAMGSDAGWSVEAQLLAGVVDQLAGANWQRGGSKGPQPNPVDRPADLLKRANRSEHHAERAARFLARRQHRGGSE